MGYTTNFAGVLKFWPEPPAPSVLAEIRAMAGEDLRDHPEWARVLGIEHSRWYHFDLVVAPDGSGLEWNGAEKTYGLEDQVLLLLRLFPWLKLRGALQAQGEEVGDVWVLRCEPGKDPERVAGLLSAPAARVTLPSDQLALLRASAETTLAVVDKIRGSYGWTSDRESRDWLGAWLHEMESFARAALKAGEVR